MTGRATGRPRWPPWPRTPGDDEHGIGNGAAGHDEADGARAPCDAEAEHEGGLCADRDDEREPGQEAEHSGRSVFVGVGNPMLWSA